MRLKIRFLRLQSVLRRSHRLQPEGHPKACRLGWKTWPLLSCLAFCTATGARVRGDTLDNWFSRNPYPTGNQLYGLTFANATFVTVGAGGVIFTSADKGI